MKSTFVKIEGQSIWFLLVNPDGSFDENIRQPMKYKAISNEIVTGQTNPLRSTYETALRVKAINEMNIDYVSQATIYNTDLLVRENGSYMPLDNVDQITETIEGYTFPTNKESIN